ncbi:hypothetical protein VE00_07824 [Pseudogymnoascus sp. WSF 3629]|nr:hypothetical protein VE00_07824 [Pseudogymnoascus sp. WSF 3629]
MLYAQVAKRYMTDDILFDIRNIPQYLKLDTSEKEKKKFTFYEGENLSCCAVSFMLALALADNAFKNKFKSLRDIYNLVVNPDANHITLEWDDEWAERPIFRDVKATTNGYSKYRYYFVRLGRVMGYEKALELYGLRRGSGKELNDALTPEERRHIMGNSGDVYERYYMPDFVDKDC